MSKAPLQPKQEPMAPSEVKNMLLAAQKQIQARQQALNFTAPNSVQQRLAELKGKIANQMSHLLPFPIEERERPVNVTIDKEGRTIDVSTGEVLPMPSLKPTLKVNSRIQKKESIKQERPKPVKEVVIEHPGLDSSAAHFDARIGNQPAVRKSRQLVFHKKGKFEEMANRQRAKEKLEKLQQEIAQIAKRTGIAVDNKVTIIQPKKFFSDSDVPDIEWWDAVIMQQPNYATIHSDKHPLPPLTGITRLIEHPIQMKPPYEPNKPVLLPIHLTKHEQRKLRRQNRAEVLKEKQEKIKLGLLPAPEPKVKISNLMRVLYSEAVQDPTKIEQYVRNQMAERIRKHEETNAARKLSAEQRREKNTKRTTEDTTTGVHAAVYRVRHFEDKSHRFKVEKNCEQLHMTGDRKSVV